ncbi:TetR/AcrR family transcriptional regulator C-terminal domain-containing protein [Nocardia sp. NPDC024068]|uniref:TetR/AcrR family transcriptional regulator C-terminal domain-containing protein n=1 Tax=Nocardia sp. NPDC024068 TaxID=3157197 RepID=UPI003407505B
MSKTPRPAAPYLVIAGEIRDRIRDGRLKPGDRVPSIRQIAGRWGVAIATATRVLATLREEGLVEAKVGAGTVVSAHGGRRRPPAPGRERSPALRAAEPTDRTAQRKRLLRSAVAIADSEGLEAVSMRRLAADLGAGPMSLYRYVANKEELLTQMADEVFGELELPAPGAREWRADLEMSARRQWRLCRRHLWLPRVISFTRPLLAPNMMAQTEWVLAALDGLGLPLPVRMHEALTLHALVVTLALSMAEETEAEQDTGITLAGWQAAQRTRARDLLDGGGFPLLAALSESAPTDLEELFEYGLARHLDGFAVFVANGSRRGAPRG